MPTIMGGSKSTKLETSDAWLVFQYAELSTHKISEASIRGSYDRLGMHVVVETVYKICRSPFFLLGCHHRSMLIRLFFAVEMVRPE